ncbi:hypothetical protein MMJ09_19920, partial [Bacillus vallismortis]|nr:hypothetical protein [Bacillus vallismortis]
YFSAGLFVLIALLLSPWSQKQPAKAEGTVSIAE